MSNVEPVLARTRHSSDPCWSVFETARTVTATAGGSVRGDPAAPAHKVCCPRVKAPASFEVSAGPLWVPESGPGAEANLACPDALRYVDLFSADAQPRGTDSPSRRAKVRARYDCDVAEVLFLRSPRKNQVQKWPVGVRHSWRADTCG